MPVPRVTKEDLKQRLEAADAASRPVIVDARLKYPYEHSTVRLPGALRMAPEAIDPARLARDRDIVVYDSDPDEVVSARVVADLINQGFRAAALDGGISEWMAANLPTEPKEALRQAPAAGGAAKG
jgi:rhodanese-related sulfurtransferase